MSSLYSRFSIQWRHALALMLFLLPWQTRLIFRQITWNGGVWEYGTVGIYATEILLWGSAIWFVISRARADHAARASNDESVVFTRLRMALFAYRKTCWCAGLFVLWFAYHLFFAPFPWVQVQAFVHIFSAIILWYLITRAHEHAQARFLQWSFLAGLGAQALLALIQFFTQNSFASRLLGMVNHPAWAGGSAVIETVGGRWLRAYGALPHPNILGGYMAVGALLVVMQLFGSPREKTTRDALRIAALLVFFTLLVSGLIVSFSRSAMLAFALGLVIMLWQHLRKIWRHAHGANDISRMAFEHNKQSAARRVSMIGLSCLLAAGVFVALVPDIFLSRAGGHARLEQQSISERIASYKGAREVLKNDWLFGTGLGNYTATLYALDSSRPGWEYQPVHNALMLAFLEFGLLMSIILIWFLFSFFRTKFLAGGWLLNYAGFIVPLEILALLDHYLWSLWSGLVLCAVVFALLKKHPEA